MFFELIFDSFLCRTGLVFRFNPLGAVDLSLGVFLPALGEVVCQSPARSLLKTQNPMCRSFELPDVAAQMPKLFLVKDSARRAHSNKELIKPVCVSIGRIFKPLFGFHFAVSANCVAHFAPFAAFDQIFVLRTNRHVF
jgi:hypothetical protein